jgi:hypothetical protein
MYCGRRLFFVTIEFRRMLLIESFLAMFVVLEGVVFISVASIFEIFFFFFTFMAVPVFCIEDSETFLEVFLVVCALDSTSSLRSVPSSISMQEASFLLLTNFSFLGGFLELVPG